MEPSEKDIDPQVIDAEAAGPEAPAHEALPEAPVLEEPVLEDTVLEEPVSQEPVHELSLEDAEPPVPVSPDLDAVEPDLPSTAGTATNLDLPSLELPHPAYPQAQPVPPAPAYQTPGQAYGQTTPYAVPEPQPAPAYGQQYSQPGYTPQAGYAPQQGYAPQPGQVPQSGYTPQGGYTPSYSGQQLAYPTGELSASDENVWSAAAHWSALLASVIGLGFLGPLIVMLTQGTKSARVRANAVESLNFEITFIIAMVVSVILILLIIGFITTPLLGIAWLILRIVAAVQTSSGQDYRYPVNIRLVK